jgi:hypothetical protein
LEVGRRHVAVGGSQHHVGLRELVVGDRLAHDAEGLQQHVEGAADLAGTRFGGDVHGNDDIRA